VDYAYHLVIFIALYVMLSQSLNLFSGYTGLLSLAHAGFYGLGAYSAALLAVNTDLPFYFGFLAAIVINACFAWAIAHLALRTYEDYFVIITLGIQVIVYSLMNNLMGVTNGPLGIAGIPQLPGISSPFSFMVVAVVFCMLIYYLIDRMSRSSYILNMRAIKDDEILLQALGRSSHQLKISSFVLSAMIAAVPGVLYAHYMSYIDPSSFTLDESIFILSIMIIGGLGSHHGAVGAAAIMVLLPEFLRFLGLPDALAANMRQIIYGGLLILLIFLQEKRQIVLKNHKLYLGVTK